jgi:hypothetical protein
MIDTELLTPHVLNETKDYLQNIDKDVIENLSIKEFKEHIKNAAKILLIEQDNFGYTMEELIFYTLAELKSSNYIKDRINEAINETSYISTERALVFGKAQKKYVVRT